MAEAAISTGAPRTRRSSGLSEKGLAFWMVSPSMLLIALVAAYPILYAIWLSLHEYSVRVAGLSRWAGLGNYQAAIQNSDWWTAVLTTFEFTIVSVVLELLIGLAMALAMHAAFVGQGLLRTVVLVPWAMLTVVPAILVALIFRTLDALRIFDLPYVLTKGAHGTTTMSLISQQTFADNRIYGLGAAYSVLTFIVVMIVSFTYIRTVGGNIRGLAED